MRPKDVRLDPERRALAADNVRLVPHCVALAGRRGRLALARDEAFAEGYVVLCDAARLYDPGQGVAFATYACAGILRRICDRRRQKKRLVAAQLGEAGWRHLAHPGPGPAEAAVTLELRRAVRRAVSGLPRRERQAVRLAHLEGLRLEGAARALGVSYQAVQQRSARALVRLRVSLEGVT